MIVTSSLHGIIRLFKTDTSTTKRKAIHFNKFTDLQTNHLKMGEKYEHG
jgi:hypothetical protein